LHHHLAAAVSQAQIYRLAQHRGGHGTSGGASVTLGEESTASTWSLMTTANETGATVDTLDGVSCHTLTYCFAVGSYTKSGKTWSLAEHN